MIRARSQTNRLREKNTVYSNGIDSAAFGNCIAAAIAERICADNLCDYRWEPGFGPYHI